MTLYEVWRRASVCHTSNELHADVVESLSVKQIRPRRRCTGKLAVHGARIPGVESFEGLLA